MLKQPLFTSAREKRYWIYAGIVVATIISTLIFGTPLTELLADQNIRAVFFVMGMTLVGGAIVAHGLKTRPSKTEVVIWIGFSAVYLMFFLRLGMAERSHLIEYSVLAIFVHLALTERLGTDKPLKVALLAFLVTTGIGALDEGIQLIIPDRVFDPVDIFFNGSVAFLAIAASVTLRWLRRFVRNSNSR